MPLTKIPALPLFAVVVVAQLIVVIKAKKATERLISGLLVIAAIPAFVA